ncbi:MAG: hypothetical protein ACFFCS_10625 [Candidatus Hodarchaeota archaeon]
MYVTIIFGLFLFAIVLGKRLRKDGKVEKYPLGMPRGTVRALVTLLIVSFPLNYLIVSIAVPDVIINAIFILVAFYYEARKGSEDNVKEILDEYKKIEDPNKKEKYPLYLPRYSVRIILLLIIILTIGINFFGPKLTFATTETFTDIIFIIVLFFIGTVFRKVATRRKEKKIKKKITELMQNPELTKYQIVAMIAEEEPSQLEIRGKNFLSIFVLFSALLALAFFIIDFNPNYNAIIYTFSLRDTLLLLINVYYGYRD